MGNEQRKGGWGEERGEGKMKGKFSGERKRNVTGMEGVEEGVFFSQLYKEFLPPVH